MKKGESAHCEHGISAYARGTHRRRVSCASGATWVSLHHGGGVGMGYSQHAGMVVVCDGTEAADRRLARVLWNDPATGVMRHADAGYDTAIDCAREYGLKLPALGIATE